MPLSNNRPERLVTEKDADTRLGLSVRPLPGRSAVRYRLSVLMEFVAQGEVPLP